ncbi:MAG: ABC transporter permease [Parasutterella sp.]
MPAEQLCLRGSTRNPKVNEELNALTTFGLSPMYFLVVPRLILPLL